MTLPSIVADATEIPPHPRSRLRARIVLASLSACGLAALAWAAFVQPLPRLVYNPSDSVPIGWYRIGSSDALHVGAIVLTTLPPDAAALAAQRRYLPAHVPLLKRVGAVAPQHVCVFDALVWIDGVPVAAVLPADRLGRPLPSWPHCRRLEAGELFLLSSTNPASFDSRYFGLVSASAVIGVAHSLWLESRP
ncbi:S26 family signal peptidase [Stenotrophomonas maltophilia]|uniref:Transmembrane anchor conjugal transfer protein n=1 Tax=Stenotrophomonas maltophilia (strain K279a) TaxID=522373 RepID=B2FTG2_STRMK|nr:S26 family signal peptidase [Stenotrophomonas maltophilia]EKU9962311.1 S26 family signal peptidase [Stenotrophomonas maltophilia]MBA0337455.1 S26 family signal peptidase [Stenotrophomonas maltophilia]MBA0540850.1 S26 family signal peptidase [Stenotrophomonas maltophilia]MBH1741134.1 S26 family signal peptidase [Stenotrophomonas maltophilia]MBY8924915.1 S26 family signal peptidase [Stenotrophomonas maltophilia]